MSAALVGALAVGGTGIAAAQSDGSTERRVDTPFLMPIEDVFSIAGRGGIAAAQEDGTVDAGDFLIWRNTVTAPFEAYDFPGNYYESRSRPAAPQGWGPPSPIIANVLQDNEN